MKARYKKFDKYLTSLYYGLNITPLRTQQSYHLVFSQTELKLSDKMKNIKKDKRVTKFLRDFHHRIKQKEQRILRKSKKQFIGVIDEIIC